MNKVDSNEVTFLVFLPVDVYSLIAGLENKYMLLVYVHPWAHELTSQKGWWAHKLISWLSWLLHSNELDIDQSIEPLIILSIIEWIQFLVNDSPKIDQSYYSDVITWWWWEIGKH